MKTVVTRLHALIILKRKARYLGVPDGHEARIRDHRKRVAKVIRDPDEPEPLMCWGPCGRVLPRYSKPSKQGWKTREVKCGPCFVYELQCPECFRRWGWIKFKDHGSPATDDHEGTTADGREGHPSSPRNERSPPEGDRAGSRRGHRRRHR